MISKRDEELGKSLFSLANMILVLFLLNNVLLSDKNIAWEWIASTSAIGSLICVLLYYTGYNIIRKSEGA